MILYSINYSRPDIFHVVSELCRCMDGVSMGTYLEMLKVIKFVLGHRESSPQNSIKI
jgi:hypothetical protein